jgi:hypothetical protein
MTIKDPTIYPVSFSIGKRYPPIIENKIANARFRMSGSDILKKTCYFYDETYLVDTNLSSSSEVSFVDAGKTVSFEITANGTDFLTCSLSVKTWTSEKSFFSANNGQCFDLRQSPWPSANTSYSFYESANLARFDALVRDGVSYYPSIDVNVSFYPEYKNTEVVSPVSLSPGSTDRREVIQTSNFGLLSVIFTTSTVWYYDKERTLPVSVVPVDLSGFPDSSFAFRTFFVIPGKFFTYGSISNGEAVYSGILTREYVLATSRTYGSLSYIGYNTDNLFFVDKEDEVLIDQNGYCVKPGQEGYVYFL